MCEARPETDLAGQAGPPKVPHRSGPLREANFPLIVFVKAARPVPRHRRSPAAELPVPFKTFIWLTALGTVLLVLFIGFLVF